MDRENELVEIAALVREHLAWEALAGGLFVPPWDGTRALGGEGAGEAPETPQAWTARPDPTALQDSEALGGPTVPAAGRCAPPASALASDEKRRRLATLASEAAACVRCRLHQGRTHSVFARGSIEALVAFVGEGPGYHEDQRGEPFVGPAGRLLDKMIAAMGLGPDEVYVCNVVKCRPPENRTPLPDEVGACEPFLRAQIEVVAPRVIVALGRCAAETLGCAESGRSWRGIWGAYCGIPVMPTYHPAFLLRNPEMKRPVWEDLQKVLQRLGRTPPRRGGGA
jgi:DNA polymerase